MTLGLLVVSLCLAQTDPLPPPSPPPLVSAPDELPPEAPPAQQWIQPAPPPGVAREPVEPLVEPAPGTPTVWWKRTLAEVGISAGVGFGLGTLTSVLMWQATCPGRTVCSGSDLYFIVLLGGLVANFTIPAAVSIVGRAMGGRAKYGYSLLGSSVFGIAGLILSIALTGGGDVPIAMIPIFSTLMLAGAVGAFELVSYLREPKVTLEPAVALVKGGGMLGVRGSF